MQVASKVLIIGWGWPEPDATAAGVRLLQLITFFKEQGCTITFATTASKDDNAKKLALQEIETVQIVLNSTCFDIFLKTLNPAIVLFDRFLTEEQFGWRVSEVVPNALKILDTEDLHSLRKVREQCYKEQQIYTTYAWLQNATTKREIASILRCDLSLIISSFEIDLLLKIRGIDKSILLHLPFMIKEHEVARDTIAFDERADFIFIGGGKHLPNIAAIKELKTNIWPSIRKLLPSSKLLIYGAYLPQQIVALNDPKTGFCVQGKAANVQNVMAQVRVCLAPLPYGAGIKGKLLHAMQFGTPSITTNIGAEGMHSSLPWNGTITDDKELFVQKAVALYTDKENWKFAQENGFKIIAGVYNFEKLATSLLSKIDQIEGDLQAHRNDNFMGAVLQHQTVLSTKFMSKWIEEKNKIR